MCFTPFFFSFLKTVAAKRGGQTSQFFLLQTFRNRSGTGRAIRGREERKLHVSQKIPTKLGRQTRLSAILQTWSWTLWRWIRPYAARLSRGSWRCSRARGTFWVPEESQFLILKSPLFSTYTNTDRPLLHSLTLAHSAFSRLVLFRDDCLSTA